MRTARSSIQRNLKSVQYYVIIFIIYGMIERFLVTQLNLARILPFLEDEIIFILNSVPKLLRLLIGIILLEARYRYLNTTEACSYTVICIYLTNYVNN